MSKIVETRKERCNYGLEDKLIKQFSKFGWTYSSKQLLNRFGNPVPVGVKISESDLRAKCYYDVSFVREIDKEKMNEVNALHEEFKTLLFLPTHFTPKRIGWSVFVSIVIIALIISAYLTRDFENKAWIGFMVGAIVVLLGLIGIIVHGIFIVKKNTKRNEYIQNRKAEIEEQANNLLKE